MGGFLLSVGRQDVDRRHAQLGEQLERSDAVVGRERLVELLAGAQRLPVGVGLAGGEVTPHPLDRCGAQAAAV